MDLKEQLIELKHKESLQSFPLDELIRNMLKHIGTIDSELRDNLIYLTFVRLIFDEHLNNKQLEYILNTCLDDNHLFYRIGETYSDSVFTRSFSSLVLAAGLIKDKEDNRIPHDIIIHSIESSLSYLLLEEDTRGYVEGKGWAHSIAHGADFLVSVIAHPKNKIKSYGKYLEAIRNCLFKITVYIDEEDKRLTTVINSLLAKGLREEELVQWVSNILFELERVFNEKKASLDAYHIKTNVMNFLKTLYFRLAFNNTGYRVRIEIKNGLKDWQER